LARVVGLDVVAGWADRAGSADRVGWADRLDSAMAGTIPSGLVVGRLAGLDVPAAAASAEAVEALVEAEAEASVGVGDSEGAFSNSGCERVSFIGYSDARKY
jgi:hypothetical protein